MSFATKDELKAMGYVETPDGWIKLKHENKTDRVSSGAVAQQNPRHESMGPAEAKNPDAVRRLVRITSFRCRLIDGDNLFVKYLVDALVKAGILFDDSEAYCQVEVKQEFIYDKFRERTQIEVTDLP